MACPSIFVHSGCYDKTPEIEWLINHRSFSQFWALKVRDRGAWVRARFYVKGFLLDPPMAEGARELS